MLKYGIDIKSFAYGTQGSRLPNLNRVPKHRPGEQFLKGPIPLSWIERAARLGGKSLHVGLALWFSAGIRKQSTIPVSNSSTERFGVGRATKYRALRALECAGLVSVCHRPGCSPLVTIFGIHEGKEKLGMT